MFNRILAKLTRNTNVPRAKRAASLTAWIFQDRCLSPSRSYTDFWILEKFVRTGARSSIDFFVRMSAQASLPSSKICPDTVSYKKIGRPEAGFPSIQGVFGCNIRLWQRKKPFRVCYMRNYWIPSQLSCSSGTPNFFRMFVRTRYQSKITR